MSGAHWARSKGAKGANERGMGIGMGMRQNGTRHGILLRTATLTGRLKLQRSTSDRGPSSGRCGRGGVPAGTFSLSESLHHDHYRNPKSNTATSLSLSERADKPARAKGPGTGGGKHKEAEK